MNPTRKVQYAYGISKEALYELWITCFPEDANGFARRFLDEYFRPDQAICIASEDGKRLESDLYWLPCTYHINGTSGTLLYIYGMGTHPDFRRKGNLRAMLEFTEQHCLQNDLDGLVLHAMDTSKSCVEAFGMKPIITMGEETLCLSATHSENIWCLGSFEEFSRLRNNYLRTLPAYIVWEARELQFVYEDLLEDGKLRFFRDEGTLHYAILQSTSSGVLVEETDAASCLLSKLSGKIVMHFPGEGVYTAHMKSYKKSLQEQDACKLYFTLLMK